MTRDQMKKLRPKIEAVLEKIAGVHGFGFTDDGILRIYVDNESVGKNLPHEMLGFPVEIVVTGEIQAIA